MKQFFSRFRTYQFEAAFVLTVLIIPFFFAEKIRLTEVIGTLAVHFTFLHAQIADRMQERQAAMIDPDVECHWKSNYFFILKEMCWISFFLLTHSWAALMGAVMFCLYPLWRKWYRKHYPLDRHKAKSC